MGKYLSIDIFISKIITLSVLSFISTSLNSQSSKGFLLVDRSDQRQIDVLYKNKLLTSYCYYESSKKPILFPVNTVGGITVTRSYPFHKIAGERTDHPHHTGIWLNYESVNGLDFWNNSTAIAPEKSYRYGTILHQDIISTKAGNKKASIQATAHWVRPDHKVLLDEKSTYTFSIKGSDFIIDRMTTLTAKDTTVIFKDVKDGMFAIRVARELELPSKEKSSFVDMHGNVTNVIPSTDDVTGMFYSSTGRQGDAVWGTQANWMMLSGKKESTNITIAIFDHPSNPGYPAYWHARGYGLFAVNPLGRKIFSNGVEELNLSLNPKQSVTFRYRVIIHSGVIFTKSEMDKWAKDFIGK